MSRARKINVKLLRKIQKHILEEPKRYEQNVTIERGEPGEVIEPDIWEGELTKPQKFAKCGTAGCIGGWAQLLGFKRPEKEFSWDQARRALHLSEEQAQRLFAYTRDEPREADEAEGTSARGAWPQKFRDAYRKAKTVRARAKVAVARIDHFIATGGKE